MNSVTYPNLLERKARVFATLNRNDLMFVGGMFMLFSLFKLNGIITLSFIAVSLWSFKFISSKLPKGFIQEVRQKELLWYSEFGRVL